MQKQDTTITIRGVRMTQAKRDVLNSRIKAQLALTLDCDLDGVTIEFATAEGEF